METVYGCQLLFDNFKVGLSVVESASWGGRPSLKFKLQLYRKYVEYFITLFNFFFYKLSMCNFQMCNECLGGICLGFRNRFI